MPAAILAALTFLVFGIALGVLLPAFLLTLAVELTFAKAVALVAAFRFASNK